MVIPWLITTIAVSLLIILIEYLSNPSTTTAIYNAPSFFMVVVINLLFWFPAVVYLHKNKRVSLYSSVISSLVAACLGGVSIVGIIMWFLSANGGQFQQIETAGCKATVYTSWTIGHVYYWAGIVRIVVLWGINGLLFWKIYEKFSINK